MPLELLEARERGDGGDDSPSLSGAALRDALVERDLGAGAVATSAPVLLASQPVAPGVPGWPHTSAQAMEQVAVVLGDREQQVGEPVYQREKRLKASEASAREMAEPKIPGPRSTAGRPAHCAVRPHGGQKTAACPSWAVVRLWKDCAQEKEPISNSQGRAWVQLQPGVYPWSAWLGWGMLLVGKGRLGVPGRHGRCSVRSQLCLHLPRPQVSSWLPASLRWLSLFL